MTRHRKIFLAVLAAICLLAPLPAGAAEVLLRCRWPSPNGRVPLNMAFYENNAVVVPPGENLTLTCERHGVAGTVAVLVDGAPVREEAALTFSAPEKAGAYYIALSLNAGGVVEAREICVVVPYKGAARKVERGWSLRADEQQIGDYRHPSRSGNDKVKGNPDSYQPPVWWMRITEKNAAYELSPGLAVGELVVPSEDTGLQHTDMIPVFYPMWTAVTALRAELTARLGIPGHALKLISMFRSPPYNRGVGSNAFGRHIYGDAFDFYIDTEGKGKAADLNRDGKLDRRDAYPIVLLIEDLQAEGRIPMGGIGVYNSVTGDHEVTMHLDLRGHRATWGYRYGAGGKRSEFSWQSRRFADLDRQDEERARERAARENRKYSAPNREPLQ